MFAERLGSGVYAVRGDGRHAGNGPDLLCVLAGPGMVPLAISNLAISNLAMFSLCIPGFARAGRGDRGRRGGDRVRRGGWRHYCRSICRTGGRLVQERRGDQRGRCGLVRDVGDVIGMRLRPVLTRDCGRRCPVRTAGGRDRPADWRGGVGGAGAEAVTLDDMLQERTGTMGRRLETGGDARPHAVPGMEDTRRLSRGEAVHELTSSR